MKVRNVNGTEDNSCKCGSWLEHWKKFGGGRLPDYCSEISCVGKPTIGAHVQKDSPADKNWYIVPLCEKHNKKVDELTILNTVKLVPANVSETCGKA